MKARALRPGLLAGVVLIVAAAAAGQGRPTPAELFKGDVHQAAGLTCTSCHSGAAPAPVTRTAIASLCARCHGDAAYMHRFNPNTRVDQYAQYLTSTHGKRMSTGETRVATCSDCHGAHGVRRAADPRSPVAPAQVAKTCATCHADGTRMAAFERETTPYADWSGSVHATALLERGDTSAPTCSTCHGAHGATPPGIESVPAVCAQCHVREAELYQASPKKAIFDTIGEKGCIACHGNHRIAKPDDTSIGLAAPAVCARCHDDATGGASTIKAVRAALDRVRRQEREADGLLAQAELLGMLVDDGRAALREAHEHQIHARVLVHAFADKPVQEMSRDALKAATRATQVADAALREVRVRRAGVLMAAVLIAGFLVALGLMIRRLPSATPPA